MNIIRLVKKIKRLNSQFSNKNEQMKIYTKTGDNGMTSLFGGKRVSKNHIRIESYGTVDELNCHIGLIRDQEINKRYKTILIEIQDRLFTVGAILATPHESETLKNGQARLQNLGIIEADITLLETEIDTMEMTLPPMTHFVMPGGNSIVSYCHIARCVCRRAERLAVCLHEIETVDIMVMQYLNRLSDYLFVLSRKLAFDLNATETKWVPRK